jgi:ABC-type multidrug transport system permease subunit
MMRAVWQLAWTDLTRWRRSWVLVAATLVPALGVTLMAVALTYAVGRQPVALVALGHGPVAQRVTTILNESDGFFLVHRSPAAALKDLHSQRVAAIITVPADFDDRLASHTAVLDVLINNVDLDFSDDIRRSAAQVLVEIDAPGLGELGELGLPPGLSTGNANPYRIDVAETDLRSPDVGYLAYQLVPVLALITLTAGTLVTALAMAGDREIGALRMLSVAPVRRRVVALGRLLGGTVAALAVTAAVLLPVLAGGRLTIPTGRWPAVAALLLGTAVSSVGLGVLVGAATRRVTTAALVAVNLVTAVFLLGGGFTTVAFLPSWLQDLSHVLPTYYAINGLREVMFYAQTPDLTRNLLSLFGAAAAAVLVSAALLSRPPRR